MMGTSHAPSGWTSVVTATLMSVFLGWLLALGWWAVTGTLLTWQPVVVAVVGVALANAAATVRYARSRRQDRP